MLVSESSSSRLEQSTEIIEALSPDTNDDRLRSYETPLSTGNNLHEIIEVNDS